MAKKKTKAVKAAKKAAKRAVAKKIVAKKKAAPKKAASLKRVNGAVKANGGEAGSTKFTPPSTAAWGAAGKALDGVRILDFTHVQSGPTCTQLLAYLGADCIKVERPGVGDITRTQLRDVKGQDSLYFTMLNGNKRSITRSEEH